MKLSKSEWCELKIKEAEKSLLTAKYPKPLRDRIEEYSELKQKALGQEKLKDVRNA